jgi:uncharacterized membrane protein
MNSLAHAWFYIAGGIFCSSMAQICLKRATSLENEKFLWSGLIIGSAAFYLVAFAAYYLALKHVPISKVAPVMTVGVVAVVVMYGVFAGEDVSLLHGVGLILGAISIYLILS